MIYTLTLNPAIDKTVEISGLVLGGVNRTDSERSDAGGKGINVSKVIKTLGGESTAMGIIGGATGLEIEKYLSDMEITFDFVRVSSPTRTNLKIIDTENGVNTDINEQRGLVSAQTAAEVEKKLSAALKPGDIAVLAGSAPKGAPVDIYARLVRLCNSHEARTVLDVDGALLSEGLKSKPFLVKPNIDELSRITGRRLSSVCDAAGVAMQLVRDGIPNVVVSLGGDGALFCSENGVYHARGLKVPVRSTVGAGDSMVAALCVSLERGYDIAQTITLSVAASAANVTCSGTQPAEYSLIEELKKQVSWEKII